jgi:hypothetical protein
MASKIYTLKHTKAADVAPFIRSAVVRYCEESNVSTVEDSERNRQMLIVSTGVDMIEHVDKLIAALDRPAKVAKSSNITGDGIAYGVYQPRFRAVPGMAEIIVKGEVSSGEADSDVRFDTKRNMFYFKDTPATVEDIKAKLAWLDKPIPQVRLEMKVYQVRDSDLKDIGIDYLAWKNGPGLNLFQVGFQALDLSSSGSAALQSFSGPLGGFFFAPQFDASFIRILEQSGNAERETTGELTVSNSDTRSYAISFNGAFQNIVKNSNDRTSVTAPDLSAQSHSCNITIVKPVACINNSKGTDFAIAPYFPGENANVPGVLNFGYTLKNSGGVEQSNFGTELISVSTVSGNAVIPLNEESVLGVWESTREVEETIGVPFLSEIPILKYLFSTTVTNREKSYIFLTVTPCIPDTAAAEKLPRN